LGAQLLDLFLQLLDGSLFTGGQAACRECQQGHQTQNQ